MVFDNFFIIFTHSSARRSHPPVSVRKTAAHPKNSYCFLYKNKTPFSPDFVNKLFPLQGQFCSELYRDKVKRFCLLYFNTVTRFQNEL